MTLDELVRARRSIRSYKNTPVPKDALEAILETARLAPSGKNDQTWRFTVVQNAETRQKLMEACMGQKQVGEAPITLVLWSTTNRITQCGQSAATMDCSIALSYMMLKATELGLGTCWLAYFNAPEVIDILGLPKDATVVAVSPLGYPNEAPAARPRKPLDEVADIREP